MLRKSRLVFTGTVFTIVAFAALAIRQPAQASPQRTGQSGSPDPPDCSPWIEGFCDQDPASLGTPTAPTCIPGYSVSPEWEAMCWNKRLTAVEAALVG